MPDCRSTARIIDYLIMLKTPSTGPTGHATVGGAGGAGGAGGTFSDTAAGIRRTGGGRVTLDMLDALDVVFGAARC